MNLPWKFAAILVIPMTISPIASAQAKASETKPYVGELVMSRAGQPVAPWKEIRSCTADGNRCITLIANPKTHEVAKLGDKWVTRFEATGNGKEVRRAETSLAKAIRLTPGYAASSKKKPD